MLILAALLANGLSYAHVCGITYSATIQFIDPIGKVVLEKSPKSNSQPWEIDISSIPAGLYIVKCVLEDRQKVITLPLVKM